MKRFKIVILICVALVFFAGAGLFIFVKTFDTTHFKDQLSNQLSAQLNRKVEIGKLDLSFSILKGMFLAVEQFTIKDDPRFSNDAFFRVAQINLNIDVLAFLTEKKVIVSNISVISPEINLMRDETGRLNVENMGPNPKASSSGTLLTRCSSSAA